MVDKDCIKKRVRYTPEFTRAVGLPAPREGVAVAIGVAFSKPPRHVVSVKWDDGAEGRALNVNLELAEQEAP